MKHSGSLGLGPIREDDELLDRLGRRDPGGAQDGLDELLLSWTSEIDADLRDSADHSGPWGLRGRSPVEDEAVAAVGAEVVDPSAAEPAPVRVRGSRALAVAGALVLTMSGGGVAAAMTGQDVPIVSRLISGVRAGEPSPDATPTAGAASAMESLTRRAVEAKIRDGRTAEARDLVRALQSQLGPDADPALVLAVAQLDRAIDEASPPSGPPTSVLALTSPSSTATGQPSPTSVPDLSTTPKQRPTETRTADPRPSETSTRTPRDSSSGSSTPSRTGGPDRGPTGTRTDESSGSSTSSTSPTHGTSEPVDSRDEPTRPVGTRTEPADGPTRERAQTGEAAPTRGGSSSSRDGAGTATGEAPATGR